MTAELSRRTFFTHVGRLVVLVPLGTTLIAGVGCTSDTNNDCAMSDSAASSGTTLVVTSTCDGGHDHTFTVDDADLSSPPSAGVSGNSSPYEDDQHVHTVALTQQDLQNVESGQTVAITSGVTLNHTHDFHFKKAA